jgi:putative membrane-bound dehydrogenase-like protein
MSEYVRSFMKSAPVLLAAIVVTCSAIPARAAAPELKPEDLPRVPPVGKSNVFKTFQIKNGFHLELAAAEPLVIDPIEISFDENGRMFVVEMRDYSEMRNVKPHLGRIRMLEDTNADGVFDKATVYVDDLPWPTGVLCYDGGVFVAASPDILYCKDTDGDGKADVRRVVFTGFGAGKGDKLNVQALVNCLRWGLDNRIHGQTSGNGGVVKRPDVPNEPALELHGRDFSFDPRTLALSAENGGGQYGMCFDNHGRKFVCSNSHHIQTFMYEARYAERNPFYNMPPALVDIPVDGPAAEVFRTSPEEGWRVIRTKWRVSGVVPGLIEGGGRASGYFTSATGITIYRGDAWPEDFVGDAFIADCGSNLVHRKKVRQEGVSLVAERPPDEQRVEFLTSTDIWFRPVQMANAPDGCLYVCDMYREVIEHPWSLPESIKKLLDLNSGNDRGRIYRIAPDGFKPRKPPHLGEATTPELVATLENKNAWHRETAARLLFQNQDKAAVPLLVKLLQSSKSPLGRLHALYALDGLDALTEENILTSLNDADPSVRAHGIELSEKYFVNGVPPAQLWARLRQMPSDPDITVRYQLAFTLGEVKGAGKIAPLAAIARRDADSSWTQAAILSSLAEGAGEMFVELSADKNFCESKSGQDFLRQLVGLVGAKNRHAEVAHVIAFLGKMKDPALTFSMTRALGDGMQRVHQRLMDAGGFVTNLLAMSTAVARDDTVPDAQRVPAIELLAHTTYAESAELLLTLLDQKQSQPVQLAALFTLARFTDPQLGPELTKRWNALTPRLRAGALGALLARADRAVALLQAIQSGAMRPNVLDSTQVKFLLNHKDQAVRQLAAKVLTATPTSTRQEVINNFMPALQLKGDAAHGRKIYEERCISCHRANGEGYALGPDFVTVKNTGKEKMLTNIIDPNAEVRPEFVAYVVDTKDDESLLGLVVNETATTVTLRQAYGKESVIPRANISRMSSQKQSVMPEGLEAGLTPQDMADLLEHISTVTK